MDQRPVLFRKFMEIMGTVSSSEIEGSIIPQQIVGEVV